MIEARGLTPKPGSKSPPGEAQQLGDLRKDEGGMADELVLTHQQPKAVEGLRARWVRSGPGRHTAWPSVCWVHWAASPTPCQDQQGGDWAGYGPSPSHTPSFSATYIKAYLLDNGACVAKKKTKLAKKTCDPIFQQALLFDEGPQGKVLQVSVYRADSKFWSSTELGALIYMLLIIGGVHMCGGYISIMQTVLSLHLVEDCFYYPCWVAHNCLQL